MYQTKSRVEWLIYPSPNHWGKPLNYKEVHCEVINEIDFFELGTPLPIESILLRPEIRRGGRLVIATDLETYKKKTFYREAAAGGELPGWRLGLYDPEEIEDGPDWISNTFAPGPREWLSLIDVAARFSRLTSGDLDGFKIGAYPQLEW